MRWVYSQSVMITLRQYHCTMRRLLLTVFCTTLSLIAQITPPPGGGGGGGVSHIVIAGTANQITVSGVCNITTTGTCTLSIPSPFIAPGAVEGTSFTGTDTTHTAYILLNGEISSTGQGFTVADSAGATSTLYVLPAAVNSGGFLADGGATTCPTLAAGAPTNCEALAWNAAAPIVASSVTYYICTKANGSTCTSDDPANGWNGNATPSPTISDLNSCLTVAAPCASIQGVEAKIHSLAFGAGVVVKAYLAKQTNTGTDCLQPSQVTFTNNTAQPPSNASERAVTATYPSSYLWLYGDVVTPANVNLVGSGTCGVGTSVSLRNGIAATGNMSLRVSGVQIMGYGKSDTSYSGAVTAENGASLYMENVNVKQVVSSHNSAGAAFGTGTRIFLGGTNTITCADASSACATHSPFLVAFGAIGYSWGPLASPTANTTITSSTGSNLLSASQGAGWNFDRTTLINSANSMNGFFFANLTSWIHYTEAYAGGECPAGNGTGGGCVYWQNTGTGVIFQVASEFSSIDAYCSNFIEGSCSTTQTMTSTKAAVFGAAREYGGTGKVITGADNFDSGSGCASEFFVGATAERVGCGRDSDQYVGHSSWPEYFPVTAAGYGAIRYDSGLDWFKVRDGSTTDNLMGQATTPMVVNQLVFGSNTKGGFAPGDLTGDVTTSGGKATTLTTVNSNVGTCGDSTHVGQVTLNGKGLTTACTPVAIAGAGSPPAGSPLFTTVASTTVTATSPTTLIGSVSGNTTIPANTLSAGTVLRFSAQGYYSTPATPASLTIDIKIGGSIRLTTGAVVQIASVTNGVWQIQCDITQRTAGVSGTQIGNCVFSGTGATITPGEAPMQTSSTWTVDTTGTLAVDLAATWSTATGSPTITSTNITASFVGGQTVTAGGGIGVTGGSGATPTVSISKTIRTVSGTDTLLAGDCGNTVSSTSTTTYTETVPQAGSTGFPAGCTIRFTNIAATSTGALASMVTTTSTFNGQAAWWVGPGNSYEMTSDGTNWNMSGPATQVLYVSHGTTDTLVCATISSTETAFANTFSIPANFLTVGKALRVTAYFTAVSSSSPPSKTTRLRLSTSSGSLTGTIVYSGGGNGVSSLTNGLSTFSVVLQANAAPSGSAAVLLNQLNGNDDWGFANSTAQGQSVATNGALWLTMSLSCAATTGGNQETINQFIVESIN